MDQCRTRVVKKGRAVFDRTREGENRVDVYKKLL